MKIEYLRVIVALYHNNCNPNVHTKLNLSRSNFWKYITLLEEELGFKLINRHKQKNTFTEKALIFIPSAIKALEILDGGMINALKSKDVYEDEIHLRICATKANSETWVVESIKNFSSSFPNLAIDIVAEDYMSNKNLEDYDILLRPSKKLQSFDIIWSIEYNFALFANKSYLENRGFPETPSDLLNHTIIAYGDSQFTDLDEINWHLQGSKVGLPNLKPSLVINSTIGIFKIASFGMGICSMPVESAFLYDTPLHRVLPQINGPKIEAHCMINKRNNKKKREITIRFAEYFQNFLMSKKGIKIIYPTEKANFS